MEITSEKVNIGTSKVKLFAFLSDTNNFEFLLPKDKISDWRSDATSCSFKVQNAVVISLLQKELNPFSNIVMESGEKSPFPFKLNLIIEEVQEDVCQGYLEFNGEVNAFLKMMVQKPLSNLFNHMAQKLKTHFGDQI